MSDITQPVTTDSSEPKVSRFAKLRNRASTGETSSKLNSIKEKAKTGLAIVGVVSVAGVVAATVAKKKSAKVELTLPDVDVTTDSTD